MSLYHFPRWTDSFRPILGLGLASCVQDAGSQPADPNPAKENVSANSAAEMKTTALELQKVP